MRIIKRCQSSTSLKPEPYSTEFSNGSEIPGVSSLINFAGDDLHHSLIIHFLRQIDAMPPWQNPSSLDAGLLSLVGSDPGTSEQADRTKPASSTVAPSIDNAESKRQLMKGTVYVIDEETAHELDDGISVERIPGTDDQVWVHVHVADPAAVLQPGDDLSVRAARRYTSLYFPEVRWPLLPQYLVDGGVGLGTSSKGQGQRALTFSAKVDMSGDVLDYKVQLTHLENIKVMTYDAVDQLLLGNKDAVKPSEEQSLKDLLLLKKAAWAVMQKRYNNLGFSEAESQGGLRVNVSPLPLPSLSELDGRIHTFAGFPDIHLSAPAFSDARWNADTATTTSYQHRASSIVSEMMILAGRVAGACGVERKIGLPYRGQGRPTDEAALRRLAQMPRAPDGGFTQDAVLRAGISFLPAYTVNRPVDHFSMGIVTAPSQGRGATQSNGDDALARGGYLRATSPLRRYPDLVAHWQLRASLLGERLPWTHEAMADECLVFDRMASMAKSVSQTAQRFWVFTYIQNVLDRRDRGQLEEASEGKSEEEKRLQSYLVGEMDAKITLGDVRVNPATLKGAIRIQLDKLELPAECEWPLHASAPKPEVGATIKVKLAGTILAGLRNGVYCTLA